MLVENHQYRIAVGARDASGNESWDANTYVTITIKQKKVDTTPPVISNLQGYIEVEKGKSTSLIGIISSNTNLTKVTVNVLNDYTGDYFTRNLSGVKVFDLSEVKINTTSGTFSKAGVYTVRIWANSEGYTSTNTPLGTVTIKVIEITQQDNDSLNNIDIDNKGLPKNFTILPGQAKALFGTIKTTSVMTTVRIDIKRLGNDFKFNKAKAFIKTNINSTKFDLNNFIINAQKNELSVPGEFLATIFVTTKKGKSLSTFKYGQFIIKVMDPIEYKEVRYLYASDMIYVRADISPIVGQKNENEWPIVWVGIYDDENKKWLYETKSEHNELKHHSINKYEAYIPADKVPRNKNLKFMFFVDGYNNPDAILYANIKEKLKITPIPKQSWSIRYNWNDDKLEALVSIEAEKGKNNLPEFYIIIYDDDGTEKYKLYDINNITKISYENNAASNYYRKYYKAWDLERDLHLQRDRTYKCAVIAKGYEEQFLKNIKNNNFYTADFDYCTTMVKIYKPEVKNKDFANYNSNLKCITVDVNTIGIPKNSRLQLYCKENQKYFELTRKSSDLYLGEARYNLEINNFENYGFEFNKQYSFVIYLIDKNNNTKQLANDTAFIEKKQEITINETFLKAYDIEREELNFIGYNRRLAYRSAKLCKDAYNDETHFWETLEYLGFDVNKDVWLKTYESKSIKDIINIENKSLQAVVGIRNLSSGKKVIAISFKGTSGTLDYINDFRISWVDYKSKRYNNEMSFYKGFYSIEKTFEEIEDKINLQGRTLKEIIQSKDPNYIFWITGHSLGGAIATIYSIKLFDERGIDADKIFVYTFGTPAVGDKRFIETFDDKLNMFSIVNEYDPVPYSPIYGDKIADYLNLAIPTVSHMQLIAKDVMEQESTLGTLYVIPVEMQQINTIEKIKNILSFKYHSINTYINNLNSEKANDMYKLYYFLE
ncbi:Lipase (class 3) [Caloramator quimbayensis]|uniref:Lipase (Class 3) n=1 Tax=Caloramator quimbayensis TaxID=1147123 RepID=A0A1T4WM14_9CLOT|nr:lipase family protein [Caloramator quimbayensis]SKA77915.1 Lipase (class 3) [Caloramator quimbayensis]